MLFQSLQAFLEQSDAHRKAVEFMEKSEAADGVNYDWAWEYAKDLWKHRDQVFTTLDEKADVIIKYLGGGTGLFTIGVLAKIEPKNVHLVLFALPAILSAITAVILAVLARSPNLASTLPTVKHVKLCSDEKKELAPGAFLGQWNLACEDMRLICDWKGRKIALATAFYCAALVLLLLPLIAAVFWPG